MWEASNLFDRYLVCIVGIWFVWQAYLYTRCDGNGTSGANPEKFGDRSHLPDRAYAAHG